MALQKFNRPCEDVALSCTTGLGVPPGTYRLTGLHMTCQGSCGHLDPAQDLCALDVRIESGRSAKALIDADDGGCQIRLE